MVTSESRPLKVGVYDRDFEWVRQVPAPSQVTVTPRFNGVGTAEFTVPARNPAVPALLTPGARVVLELDTEWDSPQGAPAWHQLMSGPVRLHTAQGPERRATYTFRVEDDLRLLHRVLGWPVPSAPLADQSAAAYHTVTDPAETVLKTFVSANAVDRLGLPVVVAPDLGRGATITVSMRMHPLADRLLPAVEQAGLGITVRQTGTSLEVDVFEPAPYARPLSEASGALRDWQLSAAGPDTTRVVVGGAGEGTDRIFQQVTAPALEVEWGDVVETFRDARDTDDGAVMDARGREVLAAGAPTSGFSVTLADTPGLRYGRDFTVGSLVTVDVAGTPVTDVLRQVVLTWTPRMGLRSRPAIGERRDDPDYALARLLTGINRTIRTLGRV